jgi:hypothetical protein
MSMQLVRSATGDGELDLEALGRGADGELSADLNAYTTSLRVRGAANGTRQRLAAAGPQRRQRRCGPGAAAPGGHAPVTLLSSLYSMLLPPPAHCPLPAHPPARPPRPAGPEAGDRDAARRAARRQRQAHCGGAGGGGPGGATGGRRAPRERAGVRAAGAAPAGARAGGPGPGSPSGGPLLPLLLPAGHGAWGIVLQRVQLAYATERVICWGARARAATSRPQPSCLTPPLPQVGNLEAQLQSKEKLVAQLRALSSQHHSPYDSPMHSLENTGARRSRRRRRCRSSALPPPRPCAHGESSAASYAAAAG